MILAMTRSACLALLLSGCLSSTHIIPKADLMALTQEPPEVRAQHVRVIQGFQGADEPPAAPRVGVETVIIVTPPPPLPVARPSGISSAKGDADRAKMWLIVAAVTALGLAVTEGSRLDGWVAMHPMQPVHLYGPGGYTWVPLAQLDAQTAAWAEKAFVREEEGPPWQTVARAPLDRRGGTFGLLLGGGQLFDLDGTSPGGFLGHIELGFAPVHQLAILLDFGLGFAESATQTLYESRSAVELKLFPFAGLRPLHPGVYGELGLEFRNADDPSAQSHSIYAGAGGVLELELTARLALTVRGGLASEYSRTGAELVGGITVY
jgi:hypothetical protein